MTPIQTYLSHIQERNERVRNGMPLTYGDTYLVSVVQHKFIAKNKREWKSKK